MRTTVEKSQNRMHDPNRRDVRGFPSPLGREVGVRGISFRFMGRSASRRVPEPRRSLAAFTMVEIAISLAVIGFALVAIIGILPTGMNVQKDNRQETIINQDAAVWMDAIRNGLRGLDDLTNYVLAITNYARQYPIRPSLGVPLTYGYTRTVSTLNGNPTPQPFLLTNGLRIVGLLSTPKIIPVPAGGIISNHVVAIVRSMSGPASEKFPQADAAVQDFGLTYRMIPAILPFGTNFFHPTWTMLPGTNSPDYNARVAYVATLDNLATNLYDLRLTFRWPQLPNGDTGPGRQVFRTMVSGHLQNTYDPTLQQPPTNLWLFQPRSYVQVIKTNWP